jgi:hypothetical protein
VSPATADVINGSFESIGAVCAWLNLRAYLKTREVKGVYWPVTLFFSVWGWWNLLYYPSLHQWGSFIGGGCLAAGNTAWVVMVALDLWRKRWVICASDSGGFDPVYVEPRVIVSTYKLNATGEYAAK